MHQRFHAITARSTSSPLAICRVVFIEPYPKSLAEQLHGDAIAVDDAARQGNVVHFQHFTGVSPRNYIALFTTTGKRKNDDGTPREILGGDNQPEATSDI